MNDQEFLARKIRTQYVEKEQTELDELKALDAKVKHPATVFAYLFGCIGAIIMGSGMSLIMTEIGERIGITDAMVLGITVGAVGLLMTLINFPIYKRILGARRQKYADKILELSEKIIKA